MKWSIERKIMAVAGIIVVLLLINELVSYRATRILIDHERLVSHTYQALAQLEATLSTVKDAETGERGYIISGDESYLEPYRTALDEIRGHVEKLRQLTADNPTQQARIAIFERKIAERLVTLKRGIDLNKASDVEGARQLILSGLGKRQMNDLRQQVEVMESEENELLRQRSQQSRASGRNALVTDIVPNLVACVLLVLIFYIIIRDVTARKRAEEVLRQQREWLRITLSSIGDAVIATDTQGCITFMNSITESLTGWSQQEAEGKPLTEVFRIINAETRQPAEDPVTRVLQEGKVAGLANHTRLIARDGTERPIDDSAAPIQSEGKLIGVVLIFRDVTERNRHEEARLQLLAGERAAREQAEAASRSKDEFVAMISHELRSPLNSILGWAHLLRTAKLDPAETARAVEVIESNARAQARLIEDLLDISRAITGKLNLNIRPVDPAQSIQAAIESIRPAADAKSLQLEVHLEPKATWVSGDANRLQQIVWNLLSNAVKFTPRYGRIDVRAERIDSHVQITVSDSGMGISREFLPFVFERFSQANTTSERKYGGLGLGLSIVRHLVELHGGTVCGVSPGEGQGASFTVTLPVRVVRGEISETESAVTSAKDASSLTEAILLEGLRVMIVDDEAETRELLTIVLTRRGAEIRACSSAAEALEAIKQWRPSVLVSDIGMPGEDGFALIKKLRALEAEPGRNIPAVALTAYARSDDRLRALAAGFQIHVPKPVDAAELMLVIASLAGRMGKSISA
jgi:PAS domain S-box-containing protein